MYEKKITKIASNKSSTNLVSEICFNVFRNGIEGACEEHKKHEEGIFWGAAAVTRTLMNESGLHAASIGVTHTAAGYAALIGRASRRICGSFAKRSAYMHLGCPNQDPRRSALFSLVVPRCASPRREPPAMAAIGEPRV